MKQRSKSIRNVWSTISVGERRVRLPISRVSQGTLALPVGEADGALRALEPTPWSARNTDRLEVTS